MRFKKARAAERTLNDLNAYISGLGSEPIEMVAREVWRWGEVSEAAWEEAIAAGRLEELVEWRERYSEFINDVLAPMQVAAYAAGSAKATSGKVVLDSQEQVLEYLRAHGAEMIRELSEESKRALSNILIYAHRDLLNPEQLKRQARPLIGLNERQAISNARYVGRVYEELTGQGLRRDKARERALRAGLKYARRQHRYRAETIILTELAYAYNRGAHEGVRRAIGQNLMPHCEMIWSTAGTHRVCGRCLELKDKTIGTTAETGVTLPPLHPRCRCAIIYREVTENYRETTPDLPYKPVSEERYRQLIIPLKKMGVTIHRDEEAERLLNLRGAVGDTIGTHDVYFRKKVSISAILEETHHIRQNRRGMNDDKEIGLRSILNETDAKEYLLRVAKEYGIPREETEETKIQLQMYKDALKAYKERHGELNVI